MNINKYRKAAIIANLLFIFLIISVSIIFDVEKNEGIKLAIKNFGNISIYPNENLQGLFAIVSLIFLILFYIAAWKNSRKAIYYYAVFSLAGFVLLPIFSETGISLSSEIESSLGSIMSSVEGFIFSCVLFFGKNRDQEDENFEKNKYV
jgi:hypothetical protein